MAEFVDYYEILNLDRSNSAEDINKELSKLESTWKRREITNPEKATKTLALIMDARKAFQNEQSKNQYDFELDESKRAPVQIDHDVEREAEFQKYRAEAESYYLSGNQKELAYRSMERALRYKSPNLNDDTFSYMCSMIRYDFQDLEGALSDINDAIAINPNNATYYRWRGYILGYFFNAVIEANGFQAARQYLAQNRYNVEKGLELATQSCDKEEQILCLESLAESYSLMYDSDYDRAEKYVMEAMSIGDAKPDLQNILDRIKEAKNEFRPYQGKNHPSTSSGEGCYIATSVYGSYDCPEVWTLRRYRDYCLTKSFAGRFFIKCYYAISPTVVKAFGNSHIFNRFWKVRLDKMVKHLQQDGYSSEKYYDK